MPDDECDGFRPAVAAEEGTLCAPRAAKGVDVDGSSGGDGTAESASAFADLEMDVYA